MPIRFTCEYLLLRMSKSYVEYLESLSLVKLVGGQIISSISEYGVLHSFDLMATRLQFKGDYRVSAIRKEADRLHAEGGFRSFYRGYSFTAAANVPIELIYRTTYDYNCRTLGRSPFVSGFFADTLISVFQVPAEVITQRLQISKRGTTAFSVIRNLYSSEGIRGFYRTINIALMVHPFQAGTWWYFYELTRRRTEGNVLVSSSVASVIVSALFNPVTVVKTQIQTGKSKLTGPKLFLDLAKSSNGRMTLLTAGLIPAMTRSVFEGFIHAFTYETVFEYAKLNNQFH
jgi:hypothetical protein